MTNIKEVQKQVFINLDKLQGIHTSKKKNGKYTINFCYETTKTYFLFGLFSTVDNFVYGDDNVQFKTKEEACKEIRKILKKINKK